MLTCPVDHSQVVFNPGTVVSANFYKYADIVVSFETYANQWKGCVSRVSRTHGLFLPPDARTSPSSRSAFPLPSRSAASLPSSALVPKSAIMLHTYTGDQTTALATTVRQIVPRAAAVFITDVSLDKEDVYKRFGGNWLAFCKYVAHYSA